MYQTFQQQLEDSKDSEDVESEQENMNMDKKLFDNEVVKQFHGRSLSQKLGIFKRMLRQSHHGAPIVARPDLRLAYVIVKLGTHSGLTQIDSWLKLQLSGAYRE
jgi:hypothetical protein